MAATTLSLQLRRRTTLIVAALAILLSVGMLVAARTLIYTQVDEQLDDAFTRQQRVAGETRGNQAPGISAPGMPMGTIVVLQTATGELYGSVVVEGGYDPLSVQAAGALFDVDPDSGMRSVRVPHMGNYRVEVREISEAIVAVALPLHGADQTMARMSLFAGLLTLLAVVGAAVMARAVTQRVTAPLRRLSATASELSELELHHGEVDFPQQVPVSDLNEEHEVAQLTTAFNLMLVNVRNALEQRQASETKLRQFVADASHELRNPLAAIRGHAELAQRADGTDRDFALGRIDAESRRLTKLVNDLLLLARLDAETPTELAPVDVVEVVLNAVNDARAAGPDHIWQLQLPQEGFEVRADANRLHQVVVNLLSNARTHTPRGTTVVTRVGIRNGWGCLMVTDDGPGIDSQALPHVFERFARADDARTHTEHRSTGLGLAIVAAVVDSFEGRASVESRPGHTAFTVWLPLA